MRARLAIIILSLSLAACAPQAIPAPVAPPTPVPPTTTPPIATRPPVTATTAPARADLSGVKTYTLGKATALKNASAALKVLSDQYYKQAQDAKFDYATLWKNNRADVQKTLEQARAAWIVASPLYEQMEGVVAGVPSLADFDVILDSGTSEEEGGDNVVPFDLTLPDGKVIPKPGNLFGVTESTLWGTFPDFTASSVKADFNNNGKHELGDALPDANILKAGVDTLDKYSGELVKAVQDWEPTEQDAFTALVVMVPTMNEYFESWKNSRFIAGDASTQRDFVAISRLADIQDILSGLQVVYQGVSPHIKGADSAQDTQISQGLENLKKFVADIYTKEKAGQHFSAEDAELLGEETQNRATAITGQITQVAAKLQIPVEPK